MDVDSRGMLIAGIACIDIHSWVADDTPCLYCISPNIGLYVRQSGDPLGEYLCSLQFVRDLPVKLVLPGHGTPFYDLARRVDALVEHHEQRLQEIVNTLADEGQTAYRIASRLFWRGSEHGWQQLQPFDRLAALSETLAHLHYLTNQGQVKKHVQGGGIFYQGVGQTAEWKHA